jgi:hypothetical protein
MTDRELLEAAAKAAELKVRWHSSGHYGQTMEIMEDESGGPPWNPLTDDGDALRLAVARRFHVNIFAADNSEGIKTPGFVEIWDKDTDPLHVEWVDGNDYESATRRAIVQAAAEIGKHGTP